MRSRLTVFIIVIVSLIVGLLFARQMILGNDLPREKFSERKLRILTYASFVSATGPGGEIINRFKKAMRVDVEVITVTDAGLLLERLKLSPADVVIGLDQFMLGEASLQSEWKEIAVAVENLQSEAVLHGSSPFVPFDWSPMSFVYRQGEIDPPHDFSQLLDPRFQGKFALQDPRASSPGLQFVNWVKALQGDRALEFLQKFKPNVHSVSPSWAFSYGLFKKKQTSLVFSYLTSLAYHWGEEKDRSYQIVLLNEGHPVQIEYAAVPANCRDCDLAVAFVQNLLTPESQTLIMNHNYMFPALKSVELGPVFSALPKMKTLPPATALGKDLSEWDKVFKH